MAATYADVKQYKLPNDSKEHARLEELHRAQHHLMHNTTIHAPLHCPREIADIGSGTGAVSLLLATAYPSATIYAVDLSPFPPLGRTIPPNLQPILGNIRDLAGNHTLLQPGTLDFVFNRLLICGMSDWPSYVQSVAEMLTPGGYVEMHDVDYRFWKRAAGGAPQEVHFPWNEAVREVGSATGLDLDCGSNVARYMQDSRLKVVDTHKYYWPLGAWMEAEAPETGWIGRVVVTDIRDAFVGLVEKTLEGSRYGEEEIKQLQMNVMDTVKPTEGVYMVFTVTIGRKPD